MLQRTAGATTKKRTPAKPRFTTLNACLFELKVRLKKEALIRLGKKIADAHYTQYGNRPQKIEVIERERIMFVASYPIKFKKIIVALIKDSL